MGIWLGFAAETVVTHNVVADSAYTGISVGWSWSTHPSSSRANHIDFNHIYDVMKQLGDGGGIYTLGFQPQSTIRGNLIHAVRRSRYNHAAPNNGIFFDQGSKGYVVEGNVIYDTVHSPLRFHRATGVIVRDNVLVVPTGTQACTYNATNPDAIRQQGNTLVPQAEATSGLRLRIEKASRAAGPRPSRPRDGRRFPARQGPAGQRM